MKKESDIKELESNREAVKYIFFLFVGLALGLLLSVFLRGKKIGQSSNSSRFDVLNEVYETLDEKYYKDIKEEDLVNGAIDGMMRALDDKHSMFFNEEEKQNFVDELTGEYYGIGAEIKNISEEEVVINRVFDDSPAEKVGLKSGDIFVSIDGENAKGKTATEIATTLKSKSKDKATIVVNRNGEEITFEITKDNVTLLSVASEMLDNNIGYIAVSVFGENTYNQFKQALDNLENEGMESLIIDLRGNSGGYLTTVTLMISEFLNKDTVIYQMKTRDVIEKFYATNNDTKDYKVAILVDKESASASEIMTSALKEQYGATVVGTKTYGKGSVQETMLLSNDTLIKYTIQEWLTSNGDSINDDGIEPDIYVELSDDYKNNPSMETDNQLQEAINQLK